MSIIISLLVMVVVVGVLIYLVDLLPFDTRLKTVARVLIVLVALIWLLQILGLFSGAHTVRLGDTSYITSVYPG